MEQKKWTCYFSQMVEPNAHKIVEHHRRYDRLQKEREKKAERERLRRRAEAKVVS